MTNTLELNTEELLAVRINRATAVVWEGRARSVSSKNAQGPFDVLPMHANFISLVRNEPIEVVDAKGEHKTFSFPTSVMYVENNTVKIYADIA